MKALGWNFQSEFGCDVEPSCRAMVAANCILAIVCDSYVAVAPKDK